MITPENTAQTIAICSDWATDTAESVAIAKQMGTHDPDFTIHVGDTYYVGSPEETRSNFTDSTSAWVRGKRGSFALLGNHEMYARGVAFFKYLLKTLGIKGQQRALRRPEKLALFLPGERSLAHIGP